MLFVTKILFNEKIMLLNHYVFRLVPTRLLLVLTLLLAWNGALYAQTRTLTGRVTDAAGGPGIPGVNVLIKGTTNGTTTDSEGEFRLSVPTGATTLVISSVGYEATEVAIGNKSTLSVSLQSDTRSLNEVVVVGYGQKTTRKLTESIGTVQARDITRLPVANAEAAIQGRVSGVQITNVDGTPGSPVAIRIRGISTVGNKSLRSSPGIKKYGRVSAKRRHASVARRPSVSSRASVSLSDQGYSPGVCVRKHGQA